MISKYIQYTALACVIILIGCHKEERNKLDNLEEYLFISHTLNRDENILREDVKSIPISKFKSLILGGDLALDSSEGTNIMDELDNTFNLGSSSTLWSPGNHDYSNRELISEYTGRPTFYTQISGEIIFIVLDSQRDLSGTSDSQLEMIRSATQMLEGITHFVIISHHLIWMDDKGKLRNQAESISNAPLGDCQYCLQPNNFYSDVYPELVEIEKDGIEVICIAGDIGDKVNKFEHLTDNGIQFLASGFDPNSTKNKALVLLHEPEEKILTWQFIDVDEL